MSIIDRIFGKAPSNTVTPPQQVTNDPNKNTPQVTTAQTAQTDANGVIPQGGADPAKQEAPLSEFKELWQPTPTDPNAPKPATPITPQQMMEAASKVDFSRVISQEELQGIAAGGEAAQKALASAMNKVAQAAYGQSAVVTQKIVEQAVEKEREAFVNSLPSLIKKHTLTNEAENPAFQNPVVAPILSAISSQLVEKYPKASSQEIRKMAEKIMTGAAEMVVPQQKPPAGEPAKDAIDWDAWVKQS